MIELLSEQGLGCHLHGQFAGAFVYADDITLLAPTGTALNYYVRNMFSTFATVFDLRFNSSKTKCMYFSHDDICFMNTSINFIDVLNVYVYNCIYLKTILPIGILSTLYTSLKPKLAVFCMNLEMFLVMSKQS